jgi:hypothetical protein
MYQIKAVVILADRLEGASDNVSHGRGHSARAHPLLLKGLQPVPKFIDIKGCARFPGSSAGLGYDTSAVIPLLVDMLGTRSICHALLFPCELWPVVVMTDHFSNSP